MLVEIPPHIAVGDFVRRVKGRSSHRVRMEFPDLRKRTFAPGAATSRTLSYFRILGSTNLPASAAEGE
jgi:REP element-mobilizing transposase RayT